VTHQLGHEPPLAMAGQLSKFKLVAILARSNDRVALGGGRSVSIDFNLPRSATVGEELKRLMREIVIDSTGDLRQAVQLTKAPSGTAGAQNDVGPLIEQVLPEAAADRVQALGGQTGGQIA